MSYFTAGLANLKPNLKTYSVNIAKNYSGFGVDFIEENLPPTLPEHKLVFPYIKIDSKSPADYANMKTGQRLVDINGRRINKDLKCIKEVRQAVENSQNSIDLTVMDENVWNDFMQNPYLAACLNKKNKIHFYKKHLVNDSSFELAECKIDLNQGHQELGITIDSSYKKKEDGFTVPMITNVNPDSAACKSGLKARDLLLEVNGLATYGQKSSTIASWIRASGPIIQFLVGREKENALPFIDLIYQEIIDENSIPRLCRIMCDRKESAYGFQIEPFNNERKYVAKDVQKGYPAERAGLKVRDRILEINGECIDGFESYLSIPFIEVKVWDVECSIPIKNSLPK